MSDSNTYQAVRIGDIADWRLIATLSRDGMTAYLKNTENPTEGVVTLFSEKWDAEGADLLHKIESAVYDHPQILDDFTADIAVVAPKSMWIPTHILDEDEEDVVAGSDMFRAVYPVEEEDVMTDELGDMSCLYTLAPGLPAFIQRTFAGARVRCHFSVLAERFRERGADIPRVYCDIREGEADFLAFDGRKMLMAATHRWTAPADIKYHVFNILAVYGLDPASVQVSLSGLKEVKTDLMKDLRKDVAFVMLTMLPSLAGKKTDMPTVASLLMRG